MFSEECLEILSIEDACEMLSVGKSTLYQLLSSGEIIGAFRIGKTWKIPRKAISDYVIKRMGENSPKYKNFRK